MNEIDLPKHVAIIMDGNRRWAKEKGKDPSSGHLAGAKNLEKLCIHILKKGIKTLSVFAFSTENFKRDQKEVDYLMELLKRFLKSNISEVKKNNIRIVISGRENGLRSDIIEIIEDTEKETMNNTGGILNICLNYGGQQEIVDASKKIAKLYADGKIDLDELDVKSFYQYLYKDLDPIDFVIRTSGEERISNFLIYQLAYSELYFTDKYFPDFDGEEFDKALDEYKRRQRRFGG